MLWSSHKSHYLGSKHSTDKVLRGARRQLKACLDVSHVATSNFPQTLDRFFAFLFLLCLSQNTSHPPRKGSPRHIPTTTTTTLLTSNRSHHLIQCCHSVTQTTCYPVEIVVAEVIHLRNIHSHGFQIHFQFYSNADPSSPFPLSLISHASCSCRKKEVRSDSIPESRH